MDRETKLKIRILKAARERLRKGLNSCICFAVDDCMGGYWEHTQVKEQIGTAVMHALGKHAFYDAWAKYKLYGNKEVFIPNEERLAREGRIAWINDMIRNLGGEP